MTTLLNLDTYRNEIVNDTYHRGLSASSLTRSTIDSRNTTCLSGSECIQSDSSNVLNMDSLNITDETETDLSPRDIEVIEENTAPYLEIIEQPDDKFRFRYKSEMRGAHGSLMGTSTNKIKRSFPSVHLHNFNRSAIIKCSLFQSDSINLCHHAHNLVMRKDSEDKTDLCSIEVPSTRGYTAVYKGMAIIQTAKKFIVDTLHEKFVKRKTFETSRDITSWERAQLRRQAENEYNNMNLNQVSLCFEAFEFVDDKWISLCKPVLSNPINNLRNALTGELKITRLSSDISEACGGEELFLFVVKVQKKNINVRFFETDENDEPIWEDWGKFSETDVHYQYAIALQTPPYKNKNIDANVDCWIQLVRSSDKCYPNPIRFRYKPSRTVTSRKRARLNSSFNSLNNSSELQTIIINDCEAQTISKEYNKSGMIDDVVNHQESLNSIKEDFENLLKFMSVNYNNDDLVNLIDTNQSVDSRQLSKDLNTIQPLNNLFATDTDIASINNGQFSSELPAPLMQNLMLRNSKDLAADTIKRLSDFELQNDQCILDFLITNNPEFFKYGLNLIEKLGITEVLNYQNNQYKSCFNMVCENYGIDSILEIFPILIRLGANPNLTDEYGDTVLHVLIKEDNLDKGVNLLLKSAFPNDTKLNLEIRNDDSLTPLLLAVRMNRIDIAEMLLNAGASVTKVNSKDGNNILHTAVNENSDAMVKLLLNRYKELNQNDEVTRKNNANQMPIDLATAANPQNQRIIKMLKRFDHVSEHDTEEACASYGCEYCSISNMVMDLY